MQLRNVPAFGLGNHREQSNNDIQEQITAANSASPLADTSKQAKEVLKEQTESAPSQSAAGPAPEPTSEAATDKASASISDSKLSKGIDTALTAGSIVAPAARPAIMAAKAGKEVIETTIDKFREWQKDNKTEAGANAYRDAETAKFYSDNGVSDIADQALQDRIAMRMQYGSPSPS